METNAISTMPAAARRGIAGWTSRARKAGRWLLALTLVSAAIVLVAGQAARARLRAQHPPIGQLIDIGGYQLHLYCQGSGGPTVILEAGGGQPGLDWALVQPELARQARVCTYDRAGLGWSDESPRPRTAAAMAEELHALLERAEVGGPYILVGHSLGGLIARQFALAHPQEVAGMVLVDSASEGQASRIPEPVRAIAGNTFVPRLAGAAADAGLLALFPAIFSPPAQLPVELTGAYRALTISSGRAIATALAEMAAMDADPTPRPATLGDIPLVVLRHGRPVLPLQGAITPEVSQQYEAIWAQMQEELAALSPQGRVVVAEGSGHGVQLDRPDLVIAAVQEVLRSAR